MIKKKWVDLKPGDEVLGWVKGGVLDPWASIPSNNSYGWVVAISPINTSNQLHVRLKGTGSNSIAFKATGIEEVYLLERENEYGEVCP